MMIYIYKSVFVFLLQFICSLTVCPTNCDYCQNRNACITCYSSYYLNNGSCAPCRQNCEECVTNNNCTQCKHGFYGLTCERNCSLCSEGLCDLHACKHGCIHGYYEENGCLRCRPNCEYCESIDICNVCKEGFYLRDYYGSFDCIRCSQYNCQTNCEIANCRICKVEKHSKVCTGCTQNYKYSGGKCVPNAETESKAKFLPSKVTTFTKTDTTKSVILERTEAQKSDDTSKRNVESSRKTAFTKSDTTMTYTKESSVTSKPDGSINIVVIGSIAGGGVAFIIVASVFTGCYITRRQKPHRTENTNRHEEEENINIDAIVNSQAVITGNDDCLYAQVNKMNKTNNLDHKEPQTAKNKIAYNVHVDEVMVDALNVDDSDLEEIEEENTRLESEVNIPTSDTYYNTASLLRSRTEVSYLPEYIKKKTDYKKEFENLPVGLTRAFTEAMRPNNRIKNRYNGIYAYDATRVVLKSGNYVNANFIDGHKQFPAYIASLGPTKRAMSNFATFWEIIWQERTYKIVMLTTLDEAKKMKCEQYWPEQGSGNNYGDYKVRCTAEKAFSEFIVREFIVARGKETHGVTQYQYTAWPDKTVPESAASLLEFRDTVEQKQLTTAGPMMVHCSAGIGRTGTYIALDILIKEGKDDHSVDIFGCVNALRGQRVQLVQNVEQYVYLHHCVLYALSCAPEPLPVSTMTHFTSDERLSTQHKAFVSLQHMANRDKIMGAKNKTRKENRIGSDIPDDKHRVRLALIEKDYINAVYVNGYQQRSKFILAQTPLQGTLEDFVSMLYQERCPCVVCLDDENVVDKSIVQYLPLVNKVATFGQFQVICTDVDRKEDFTSRKLKVSRIGVSLSEEVSVFHYQSKGWSSIDCIPRSTQSFLNLVTDVEKTYQSLNSTHPIVVHCSTGAERSGLFCAVSILLEKVAVEKEVSVLNTVCQVCSRRRSAFQDIEHLRFCYSCVEQMSEVSDSSTYYNSRNM